MVLEPLPTCLSQSGDLVKQHRFGDKRDSLLVLDEETSKNLPDASEGSPNDDMPVEEVFEEEEIVTQSKPIRKCSLMIDTDEKEMVKDKEEYKIKI